MDDVIDLYACKKCSVFAIIGHFCCGMLISPPPLMCDAGCGRPAYGELVLGPFSALACIECAREFERRVRSHRRKS